MDINEIVAAVNEYEQQGTGQKRSQTVQVRRIIKALTLIGVKRSDFIARVKREWHRNPDGSRYVIYGNAHGSIRSHEGQQCVIEHAQVLVACGLAVHIIEGNSQPSAFVSTTGTPGIRRYNTVTNELSYE